MPKRKLVLHVSEEQYQRLRFIHDAQGWVETPESLFITARQLLVRAMTANVVQDRLTDSGFVVPGGWEIIEHNKRILVAVKESK